MLNYIIVNTILYIVVSKLSCHHYIYKYIKILYIMIRADIYINTWPIRRRHRRCPS